MAIKKTIGGVQFVQSRPGTWIGKANVGGIALFISVTADGPYWNALVRDEDSGMEEDGDGTTPGDALASALASYTDSVQRMAKRQVDLASKILAGASKLNG